MNIPLLIRVSALAAVIAVGAGAHEIGTTRVSIHLREDRTYAVEIVTDGAAFAEKLEALSGGQPGAGFDDRFLQRATLAFDGAVVRPNVTYAPGAEAIIRLTGPVPPQARYYTWKFDWIFATYSLTVPSGASGTPETVWLEGGQRSAPIAVAELARPAGWFGTAWRYLSLGFTHILPNGLDHMLFVLGIYLLNSRPRSVLLQVSAFTLAHSITLGLSMYGILSVSPAIVEPMIALSIAYVAIENVFLSELRTWRVALVFAFGLLHGLGFAGALTELSLPRSEFLTALLTFNIGVEAGQLAVIGAAFLLIGWRCSTRAWYRQRIAIPASALIACTAVYWTVERLR